MCVFLQLRVTVYDTEYPREVVTATVAVSINRNEFAPVFTESPYRVTINETTGVGTGILTVQASDADGVGLVILPVFLKFSVTFLK